MSQTKFAVKLGIFLLNNMLVLQNKQQITVFMQDLVFLIVSFLFFFVGPYQQHVYDLSC